MEELGCFSHWVSFSSHGLAQKGGTVEDDKQSLIFHGLLTAVSSLDENDCPWGPLGGRYPHASLSWNEVVPSVLPQEETCSSGRPAAWWSAKLRAPTPSTFISRNRPLTSCFCASHSGTQPYCLCCICLIRGELSHLAGPEGGTQAPCVWSSSHAAIPLFSFCSEWSQV